MEPVGDLPGLRGSKAGSGSVILTTITTDDLNFVMGVHPCRRRFRFPVGEEFDHLVSHKIDEDRAKCPTSAKGPIVNAKGGDGSWWGSGQSHHAPQQRGWGGVHAQMACQSCAQFSTGCQPKRLKHLREPGRHARPGLDKKR